MKSSGENLQVNCWQSEFGDEYIDRNKMDEIRMRASTAMWAKIIDKLAGDPPESILEVGSNIGVNLKCLQHVTGAKLYALEPNEKAINRIKADGFLPDSQIHRGVGQKIPLEDGAVDMAFTCGVMIHIAPPDLISVCREIYRCAKKYIVCIEYYSDQPEEKLYRGRSDLLFKRDFGGFWLDHFPDLVTLDVSFNWKRTTNLDNTTAWIFRKRELATLQNKRA